MEPKAFEGTATSCKVFASDLEAMAEEQIRGFLDCPAFAGCRIRVMPDVHAGTGAVIGFTSPLGPGICPNVIGVDIGCGVLSVRLGVLTVGFSVIDAYIRRHVPSGMVIRDGQHWLAESEAGLLAECDGVAGRIGADPGKVRRSAGTLGGGNHFIEIGRADSDGALWLSIHSGSRNFGLRVANWHQKAARRQRPEWGELAYLTGVDADAYLRDMRVAQRFAALNRMIIAAEVAAAFGIDRVSPVGADLDDVVESVHNFIGDDGVIRKGAISARAGERVVIPWNMRDGLVLGRGLGNGDWNNSAPHGAGRRIGRKEAKHGKRDDEGTLIRPPLSMDDFREAMAGIWSSCVVEDTLDEAPAAYKPHAEVEAWLGETVVIEDRIRPLYSFKAAGD